MPYNPAKSNAAVDAHNTGAYRYDPQNDQQTARRSRLNTFDLHRPVLLTPRFGELTPFECFYANPSENFRFSSSYQLRTYTLASPLYSRLRMYKDYFQVPLSSILPVNWDKFYANPIKGDDVPATVYCDYNISPYISLQRLSRFVTSSPAPSFTALSFLRCVYEWCLLDAMYSPGGLPCQLGLNWSSAIYFFTGVTRYNGTLTRHRYNISDIIDRFNTLRGEQTFIIDSIEVGIKSGQSFTSVKHFRVSEPKGMRDFLSFVFNDLPFDDSFTSSNIDIRASKTSDGNTSSNVADMGELFGLFFQNVPLPSFASGGSLTPQLNSCVCVYPEVDNSDASVSFVDSQISINFIAASTDTTLPLGPNSIKGIALFDISPIIAYHQIAAQFATVDAIDNLYNSKLWMQNMEALLQTSASTTFDYNGVASRFDIFSLYRTSIIVFEDQAFTQWFNSREQFLSQLFGFERSLSYGDYFLGARLEPLAVGDVSVSVNSDLVDAVDMTRGLLMSRFLNFVNRTGAQIQDYVRGLFGVVPTQVEPMPKFIVHEDYVIGGSETENTNPSASGASVTDQQGYPVLLMNSRDSRYSFNIEVDEPCLIIGLISFDMERFYPFASDRTMFIQNRFDYFQPMLQNLGDQVLYAGEKDLLCLFNSLSLTSPIGYHLRDTHYKQRYPVARGAFVTSNQRLLPSWARVDSSISDSGYYSSSFDLNSDSIRNNNRDIDDFYQSLSGKSLQSYFHFIMRVDNNLEADRPMQWKPMINATNN